MKFNLKKVITVLCLLTTASFSEYRVVSYLDNESENLEDVSISISKIHRNEYEVETTNLNEKCCWLLVYPEKLNKDYVIVAAPKGELRKIKLQITGENKWEFAISSEEIKTAYLLFDYCNKDDYWGTFYLISIQEHMAIK